MTRANSQDGRGGVYRFKRLYTSKKTENKQIDNGKKNNPYIKDLSPKNMFKNLGGLSSHAKPSSFLPHLFGWIQVEPTEDIMIQPGIFQKQRVVGGKCSQKMHQFYIHPLKTNGYCGFFPPQKKGDYWLNTIWYFIFQPLIFKWQTVRFFRGVTQSKRPIARSTHLHFT